MLKPSGGEHGCTLYTRLSIVVNWPRTALQVVSEFSFGGMQLYLQAWAELCQAQP